ncbi:WYL domain-containing protein [Neglecta sp. X4]|uniref:WYL domain-containing protein n=1 Tax=unclassified Neglectibacter TaxID=2632164 RepID=UPI00136A3C21|nr:MULTISPECIES: WYL domain-containing protein [unclassified Neglectibacter]NBI17009.1 WYL domain-containing protein [Neglectibacter sp. 59]NBJ72421.1 WYL domain-containing protein [Neglectibacter sp. X4]NCE80196.1 WYL domain-containing protein [Neglectibacter sp. X58]
MAFYDRNGIRAAIPKQRLNLSILANEVIQGDMLAFGAETRDGFLNRIFRYYYPKADASISLSLNTYENDLNELLSDIIKDKEIKRRVITRLSDKKGNHLKEAANVDEKGEGFYFNLNKDNFMYLSDPQSECGEDKYYKNHRSRYIKAVFEEYARLHYVQRELIYFTPYVQEIEQAIKGEYQLKITTGYDRKYSIYPYKILCDPLATANYLVGYSKRNNCLDDTERPCSFRISALKSIAGETGKSAFLKKEKWKQLRDDISLRGVQFLSCVEEKITVKLTEEGVQKYRRQIHLRPKLETPKEEIKVDTDLVFSCTEAQAEFYFFKFGRDVEIVQPKRLRERFISLYREALKKYDNE